MSKIKSDTGRLGLCGAEHWKCNHTITLAFKGLSDPTRTHPQLQELISRSDTRSSEHDVT